jgi:hypothetical protein
MKKYQMHVRLSYYVWVEVEAMEEEYAREQGIRKAFREMDKGHGSWGEEPEVTDFSEMEEVK